jgi:hypothetical protein
MRAGDAVFVSPDHRIDPGLCRYGQSAVFRKFTTETRRNYAGDLVLLLTFLQSRGRHWTQARDQDLRDFKDWRFHAPQNPGRIGASKSNRELAAFATFFKWAHRNQYVPVSPVAVREAVGVDGSVREVLEDLEPVQPAAGMHWHQRLCFECGSDIPRHRADRVPHGHPRSPALVVPEEYRPVGPAKPKVNKPIARMAAAAAVSPS